MANFTLEIIYPKAVGAVPNGLESTNRCYFAYPGLTYSLQVCAIGGMYPYTYELSNAPSGMSVDADTGVITWTNPQTGTHSNIQVTVTDQEANTDSETWSIVCGTSGWVFLDAVNGNDTTGDGSLSTPWQTLDKLYDSSGANSRTYFRAGTYTLAGLPITESGVVDNRIVWSASARSTIWLAYPGDAQPVIDYESTHTDTDGTPALRFSGPCTYMEGLKTLDSYNKTFWFDRLSRRGTHIRNMTFDTFGGHTEGGDNASVMMFTALYGGQTPDTQAYGDCIIGCTVLNGIVDPVAGWTPTGIKQYSWLKGLVQGCTFSDMTSIEQKSDDTQVTWRLNTFNELYLDGNFNNAVTADKCSAEICFNYFNNPGAKGAHMWHSKGSTAIAGPVYVYRNTFNCTILIDWLDSDDGPYTWTNNVIVNADGAETPWPYLQDSNVTDTSRMSITTSGSPTGTQNLAGNAAAGILDANGLLQGSYRTSYLGTQGHEIVVSGGVLRVPGVLVLEFAGAAPVLSVSGGEPAVNDARLVFRVSQ